MAAIQRFPRLPSVAFQNGVKRKGFELKYVLKPDDAQCFYCNICKLLARIPIELKHCGHVFCKECISEFSNKPSNQPGGKFKCPLNDGSEFTTMDRVALETSSKCA